MKKMFDCIHSNEKYERRKKMRKYKQVKEKKVTYDLDEWREVEYRAAKLNMKTGTYIKRISTDGNITFCDIPMMASLIKEIKAIGNNINQLVKKAHELNSIYAADIEKLEGEHDHLCHTLSQNLFTPRFTKL